MKWFLVLAFFPLSAFAQTLHFTEIAPHTLALQPEWFEFRVSGTDTVDMSNWQLSNGQNKPKLVADFLDSLAVGEGAQATDTPLVFTIHQAGYFSFSPSPIALPNNGGTLEILDAEGLILASIEYPKAVSRSTKNYEEREVLTWSDDAQVLMATPVRAPQQSGYEASKGKANLNLPTLPENFNALINEVSVDHDNFDFIEIYIASGPDTINLQYTELKHNGTPLWYFDQPYSVEVGDYLVFKVGTPDQGKAGENLFHSHKRDGLSGGSGTVELINLSGTSQEKRIDVLCWQKSDLSQTENQRVQKFMAAEQWQSACVSIQDLIPNESMARNQSASDSNTAQDWIRHFNGSIGAENVSHNQGPKAVIELQGTKKSVGEVSFQVNPTGENSHDPDGIKDLKSYWWELNDVFISDKANPAGFYIETEGEHELSLTVTDQSGERDTTLQLIVGLPPGSRNTNNGSAKARAAVVENLLQEAARSNPKDSPSNEAFFSVFMNRPHWTDPLALATSETTKYPNYAPRNSPTAPADLYDPHWKRQINLPKPVRHRLKKNLGILFSWRESPWPGLAAEWTAVVKADRTSGYFDLVYRGF